MHIQHRTWHHRHHGPGGRRILGLLVLGAGIVLLLRALHVPGLEDLHRWFWPAALVGTGAAALAFGRGGERAIGGLLLLIGVPMAANRFFGWDLHVGTLIWPAMLVFFGLRMLLKPPHDGRRFRVDIQARVNDGLKASGLRGEDSGTGAPTPAAADATGPAASANADADPASQIREFAFLGGIERNNTSQAFRGGEVTAALGGVELDLRDCRMAPEGARLDVLAFMGGVSLRIPKDWCVVSDVSVMLGGLDNRTSAPVDGAAPKLHITGQAIMGGIEIKN
ncbi:MAG: DUF5668 domain-containing protein [Vicinamibacterales bacterium]